MPAPVWPSIAKCRPKSDVGSRQTVKVGWEERFPTSYPFDRNFENITSISLEPTACTSAPVVGYVLTPRSNTPSSLIDPMGTRFTMR